MGRESGARQGVNSETLGNSELPSGRLNPKCPDLTLLYYCIEDQ